MDTPYSESRPERHTPEYKAWRNKVYQLDNWTCVLCGAKGNLEAHHISPWATNPEKRYMVSNGVSLCQDCHDTVNGYEEKYATMFHEIVSQRMDAIREKSKARGGRHRKPWKPTDWSVRY